MVWEENIYYLLVNVLFLLPIYLILECVIPTDDCESMKSDKSLKNDLAEDLESNADLLSVSKHIFGRNVNKEFRSIINGFRNDFYYPLTLPWSDSSDDNGVKVGSGWRLLPNSNCNKLLVEINSAKLVWDREVSCLL